jgi:NADH-quinone oxidoreductase subunit N
MAYSSISHAGYMLIAIVAMNSFSQEAILYYSAAYTFATIAAFAVQHVVEQHHERDDFEIFHGIGKTNPFLALVGTVAMLSLAGIPLTGGFIGKLMVFTSAYQSGFGWLLIVAVLMSTVSMYYYLRLPIAMLLKKTVTEEKISVSPGASIVLWICLIGTVVLGLFPNLFTSLF